MNERRTSKLLRLLGLLVLLAAPLAFLTPQVAAQSYSIIIGDSFVDANNPPCTTGTATMIFTAVLSNAAPAGGISFNFATANNTAVATIPPAAGDDYTSNNGTATFSQGSNVVPISVTVACNAAAEPDETFFINLTNPTGGATISDSQAIGTIRGIPLATIANASVIESNATQTATLSFVVSIPRASGAALDFTATTTDGTATVANSDYTALAAVAGSIPAGQLSTTVNVTITGDNVNEADETLTVTLTAVTAGLGFTNPTATGIIVNDDAAPVLSITCTSPVTEGVATSCTANLTAASGQNVTVTAATADSTALAGSDYTTLSPTVITILAGSTASAPFAVATTVDTLNEATETFLVNLSSPTNATIGAGLGSATITITDDDPLPTVAIGNAQVLEGPTGGTRILAFPISLSATSGQEISVSYNTADATAQADTTNGAVPAGGDYLAATGGIATFTPGIVSQNISIVINGDNLDEFDETFTVTIAASSPTGLTITNAVGTGTIQDDDDPPSISINNVTVIEGNTGTVDAIFTATLSTVSGKPISVNYATANGTATAGSDYAAATGTLSIAAGSTSATLTVKVNGDTLAEDAETFYVSLNTPVNVSISTNQGTGLINDDDSGPQITISDATVTEGDGPGSVTAKLTVSLSATSGKTITVSYRTTDATAQSNQTTGAIPSGGDYTALPLSTISFPPGITSQDIFIDVRGDMVDENNETFTLDLSNAVNASINDGQGVVTITDNDAEPQISIGDATVPSEGAASTTTSAVFVLSLSQVSGRTVTVDFTTQDGTGSSGATSPSDYRKDTRTVTFPAGATTQTVSVAVYGDNTDESNESFTAQLTNPKNATLARSVGEATIFDDDGPTVSINDASVNEGNSGTTNLNFTVTLTGVTSYPVTVQYATADGTATLAGNDYTSASGTLTFSSASDTSKTVAVLVKGDTVSEANETVFINLSNPSTGIEIGVGKGTGTIINDDSLPQLSLVCPNSVNEGASGSTTSVTCEVRLSASTTVDIRVSYSTVNGTAIAPADYASRNETLTFPAGTTMQRVNLTVNDDGELEGPESFSVTLNQAQAANFSIPIVNDTLSEGNEAFSIQLSNAVNAVIDQGTATITIIDDDQGMFRVYLPLLRK